MSVCHRCRRPLSPGQEKRVPKPIAALFSIIMAFMHGGLWFQDDLQRVYCARCRAGLAGFVILVVATIAPAIAIGIALWLKGPRP